MIEKTEFAKGELISLFSTPVVVTNIGRDFTKDEINYISNIPTTKKHVESTNRSSSNMYVFEDSPNLKDIKIFCEHQLKQYLEHIEGVDTNLTGLRITQSWVNKTKPQECHHRHTHTNSYLSGVLYINCLPNDHIIITNRSFGMFDDMRFQIEKNTPWNSAMATIYVKEGDLLIFPSWVPHYVDVNETKDTERISLAFNTFPTGELGNYDEANHLKL